MRGHGLFMTVAIVIAMVTKAVDAQTCSSKSDGCSVPFGITVRFQRLFTPSCHRHDVCYGCGSFHGFSRTGCDRGFLNNMLGSCKTITDKKDNSDCRSMARLFYVTVRLFGGSRYHKPGKVDSHCSQSWVRPCMP